MTPNEVVALIAATGCVESIVAKITGNGNVPDPTALKDLSQDIYSALLADEKIGEIFEQGHINFYVARIVMNQIMSSTSYYYRTYVRPRIKNSSLNTDYVKNLKIDDGENGR